MRITTPLLGKNGDNAATNSYHGDDNNYDDSDERYDEEGDRSVAEAATV